MGSTKLSAIFLIILCTLFTSAGQLCWKFSLKSMDLFNLWTWFNWLFILGSISYGAGAILMILAFQRGELSVLYPIFASSYVWVSLVSPLFFPTDVMNYWKWSGIILILVSISVLSWRNTEKRDPVKGTGTNQEAAHD